MVTKIGIISKTDILKKALEFNLIGEYKISTINDLKNDIIDKYLAKYDILLADDRNYTKVAKFFEIPINLSEVLSYIESEALSVLGKRSPYVDGKARTLYYMNYKIPLTEQACKILQLLSFSDNMKISLTVLQDKLNVKYLNFEALKASVYRINQQFVKYKLPLKVALEKDYILLEKL